MENKETVFYHNNGIILQKTISEDSEFVEIEFRFTDLRKLNDQLLISIAAMYIVFSKPGINYVASSYTLQKFIIKATCFTRNTETALTETVLEIRNRMGLVYRLADQYFYTPDKGGILTTNSDHELEQFRITPCFGKAFVEEFSKELQK